MNINNNNIINELIKMKFKDRSFYKLARKLNKDNISFLESYVIENLNCWEELDVTKRHLYNKIKYIIVYYNLINEKKGTKK